VQAKYLDAVVQGAGCTPLVVPALGERLDQEAVLGAAHGLFLTGSHSNVDPAYYGAPPADPALPADRPRDATTLPLIRAAIERGLPLLGVCRGFQEINVALGGTLHQKVHALPGMMDHREDPQAPLDVQYGLAHPIDLVDNGRLAQIMRSRRITVNSLHGQGVDQLAPGLVVEARAEDGLVEAFSHASAPGFLIGVQWHPEWRVTENADSMKLFRAFGDACRHYEKWAARRVP
jgi:putative glutamine amidotransferase